MTRDEFLESFFPPCTDASCDRPRPHACILPSQRDLILAPEKYIMVVGGYGAGKTLPAATLGILLSLQVPGNRGIVVRRSYSKLHDSTERIFLEILRRKNIEFRELENRDGWPHRIILPNESEIIFRETKDLGRFLGPEYGWFYVDEASEEPRKTFTDLVGRLRLAHARRFLKGILTTNPPNHRHWIADVFGLAPGVKEVHTHDKRSGRTTTTRYKLMRVSTRDNPYNPESYVADLEANNPESEVRRIVEGHYGFVFDGNPVYAPPFHLERHVKVLRAIPSISVARSWDFGYHVPAVLWQQFPMCNARTPHWRFLHEYVGKDIEAEELAGVVMDETHRVFPDNRVFLDCGDAAGAQISDKGPGPIIRLAKRPFNLRFRYRHLPNVDPGIALLREAFRAPACKCGQEVVQVSTTCTHLIDTLAGGYHYPILKPMKAVSPVALKPVKDGFYDNVADSARYAGENFYRALLRDPELLDKLMENSGAPTVENPEMSQPWNWMDRVPA